MHHHMTLGGRRTAVSAALHERSKTPPRRVDLLNTVPRALEIPCQRTAYDLAKKPHSRRPGSSGFPVVCSQAYRIARISYFDRIAPPSQAALQPLPQMDTAMRQFMRLICCSNPAISEPLMCEFDQEPRKHTTSKQESDGHKSGSVGYLLPSLAV